ncbi:tripeptide aminopeptidase PepT [Candidatus Woesebacteria bacterium]|nr:MAG: tripeptide aminopeptidase PepT [Candidatus Woesebacteria bacterium]
MRKESREFKDYKYNVLSYFEKLASFPTQADPNGLTKLAQKRFAKCATYIATSLKEIGLRDVVLTKEGYVYATIPSNVKNTSPVVALMAHYDTALENPGNGTKILIHKNYQGGDIKLPKGNIVIAEKDLKGKIGHDIVTGLGDNQLGADDKTGVAAILDLARFLIQQPTIKHGTVRLIFNNNEEVGRGTEYLDYKKLGADFAYCVDAGEVGLLFEENFNAEAVTISLTGETVHPGFAKGKMTNALLVAQEFINILNNNFLSPERSNKREPYLGLNNISGTWTKVDIHYLLRAFDSQDIDKMKTGISEAKQKILKKYKKVQIEEKWDEVHVYKNAGEVMRKFPLVNNMAVKAYKSVGVKPKKDLVRGGFDGVRMSFDGLPTSNVFSAAINMHGLNEWTTRQDLELTVQMLIKLCTLWSKVKK